MRRLNWSYKLNFQTHEKYRNIFTPTTVGHIKFGGTSPLSPWYLPPPPLPLFPTHEKLAPPHARYTVYTRSGIFPIFVNIAAFLYLKVYWHGPFFSVCLYNLYQILRCLLNSRLLFISFTDNIYDFAQAFYTIRTLQGYVLFRKFIKQLLTPTMIIMAMIR